MTPDDIGCFATCPTCQGRGVREYRCSGELIDCEKCARLGVLPDIHDSLQPHSFWPAVYSQEDRTAWEQCRCCGYSHTRPATGLELLHDAFDRRAAERRMEADQLSDLAWDQYLITNRSDAA